MFIPFLKNKIFKTLLIILITLLFSNTAFAANRVYFSGPTSTLAPGSDFGVKVMIDAEDMINAIDLEFEYPALGLEFLSFDNTGSIISLWQESPTTSPTNGRVKLSGGILGGFEGDDGLIAKIYFRMLSSGDFKVNFIKKDLYIADGKATPAMVEDSSFKVSAREGISVPEIQEEFLVETYEEDVTSPELIVTLIKNPEDGARIIVFHAVDEESGIKNTQIRFKKWFRYSAWQIVENPTLYPKGAWVVELKTENNAGLFKINILKRPWQLWKKVIFALFVLLFFLILLFIVYNKWKSKKL